MTLLTPTVADGCYRFDLPDAEWLTDLWTLDVDRSSGPQRTGDGESLLVVLAGTHDLFAGGGSWVRRGLRPTPHEGRPVALFLPPDTPFRTEQGSGRLLLVSSRQPELAAPETASEAAGRKPLLPMAGSGKSFDPQSGNWKPKEAFLESPEALLPRRFTRIPTPDGSGIVERLAGADYKSLSLRVDETVLAAGTRLTLPTTEGPAAAPVERALFFDPEQVVEVDGKRLDGPCLSFGAADRPLPEIRSVGGRCYVLAAYAGPKQPTSDA